MSNDQQTAPPSRVTVSGVGLGCVLGWVGWPPSTAPPDPVEEVAAKVLHPGKTDDEEARRFKREFLTLRGLRHPSIVSVYEAGLAGRHPWITMGVQDPTRLHHPALGTSPPDRCPVESIFRDICGCLIHLHNTGLIHRDLKPSTSLSPRSPCEAH